MNKKLAVPILLGIALLLTSVAITAAQSQLQSSQLTNIDWRKVNQDGFGNVNNGSIWALEEFDGYLYAGTYNSAEGAQIWRSGDDFAWSKVVTGGLTISLNQGIDDFIEFNGYLYASTLVPSDSIGAEMWRSADGLEWESVVSAGFNDVNNIEIFQLEVFDTKLYAGTANPADGAEVWSSLATQEEAEKAIQDLNGTQHEGRSLTVNMSKPREDRPARSGGGGYRSNY